MDVVISSLSDKQHLAQHTKLSCVGEYHHQVLLCLGYPLVHPPVADLLRQLNGLSGQWLVVSPLSWEASHNDAQVIAVGQELGLSTEQGRVWFELFAEHARHYFAECVYHDATTWLIRVDGSPEISAKPAQFMRQQSLFPQLAQLDESGFWSRWLTEIQMLFNQAHCPPSETYPINGVWAWGQGALQAPGERLILTDSEINYRMACLLSTQVQTLAATESVPDSALLLLEHPETLAILQPKLERHNINWYWENAAYQTRAKHWLKRIWGALC